VNMDRGKARVVGPDRSQLRWDLIDIEILWGVDSDRHSGRVRLLTDPLWR